MNDVVAAVRLVVSDVDGTLVDKDKKLTDATIAAVKRLTDAGIAFTIISARPRSGMMPIADKLGLDGAMGAFNGGLVFRRDGTVEHHDVIDPEVARGVIALAREVDVQRWAFADDEWHATSDQGTHVEHERLASNQEPILNDDFTELLGACDKLTFVSDDAGLLAGLAKRAKAAFGDKATIGQSQTYYLDVTAPTANKGDGIAALAGALDIPLDATVAIGDQYNDVPMLTRAGYAIAMGNAPAEVKKTADAVTGGNDADGVAQAIDTLILSRRKDRT